MDVVPIRIADGPPAPVLPAVSIAASPSTVAESGAGGQAEAAVVTVTRTGDAGDLSAPLTVFLAAPTGSATEGLDYPPLPPQVTIAAGEASTTFSIVPVQDDTPEEDERIELALLADTSQPPRYTPGSVFATEVTITDGEDDAGSGDFLLDAVALSDTEIRLEWEEVLGADQYRLDVSDHSAVFQEIYLEAAAGSDGISSAIVQGLDAGSTFSYRVTAFAGDTVLAVSNQDGATTTAATGGASLSAVQGVSPVSTPLDNDYMVAFYGAGPIDENAFGNTWLEYISDQLGGTIKADTKPYTENRYDEALYDLLAVIDRDGDRKIEQSEVYPNGPESDPIRIRLLGYSYGGVSATNLSRILTADNIKRAGRPDYDLQVEVPVDTLFTIDPVNSAFFGTSWFVKHTNGPVKTNVSKYRGYWRRKLVDQDMTILIAGIPEGSIDMGSPAGNLIRGSRVAGLPADTVITNVQIDEAANGVTHRIYPPGNPFDQGHDGRMVGSNVGHDTIPWYVYGNALRDLA